MDVSPLKKHTRGGTVSFLHHLVSFSCNYNQECDNWARASDCSQSKRAQRSATWQPLHQDYLRSKKETLLMHIINCCSPFSWLETLLWCRFGHQGPAGVPGSSNSQVLLTPLLFWGLFSVLRWQLQQCSVTWKSLPCVALWDQLWWDHKPGPIPQTAADIQSTTTNLWGNSYGLNYHCISLGTASKRSHLALVKNN